MKLLLLIILLCGIIPSQDQSANSKKINARHTMTPANFDIVPSGLLFQF